MSDFKAAIRALSRSTGFSIVAIVTMAVGIGANTALFSVYDRLVLNPVTIPEPSSLVAIWTNNPQLNFNAPAVSWPRYEEIRSQAQSFASVGIAAERCRRLRRGTSLGTSDVAGSVGIPRTLPPGRRSRISARVRRFIILRMVHRLAEGDRPLAELH